MKNLNFKISFFLSLGLMLVGFIVLAMRLYEIQIVNHEGYKIRAKNIYTYTQIETGRRGRILDSQGNPLAGSPTFYDLVLDFLQIRDCNSWESIEKTLLYFQDSFQDGINRDALRSERIQDIAKIDGKLKTRGERVILRQLTLDEYKKIQEKFREFSREAREVQKREKTGGRKISSGGLIARETTKRFYPHGELIAPILGYVDYNGHGLSGIEKIFDSYMTPSSVIKKYERSAKGQIYTDVLSSVGEKRDGYDVQLTINSDLQKIVDKQVLKLAETCNPDSILVLMANPRTGAIIAASQYAKDSNIDKKYERDYISQYQYEPGSMMKGITIALAVDKGLVKMNDIIDCDDNSGLYRMSDTHKNGKISVIDVVKKSSNIGTARVCMKMTPAEMYRGLKDFGLGQQVGIGFINEYSGVLDPPKKWSGSTQSRLAIGYASSLTPLQLVQAYCALANGGNLMQLRLIESIIDPATGKKVYENKENKIRSVISPETSRKMREALASVITGGTGRHAAVKGYSVAGKTGTSRKSSGADGYLKSEYYSSFIGFVPAENPEIVLLVTVDRPRVGGYYGGAIAGPTFSEISKEAMLYFRIPETNPNK